MARVRAPAREPGRAQAPAWARATAAAAALAGVLAGVGLGLGLPAAVPEISGEQIAANGEDIDIEFALGGLDADELALDNGLAGGYWQALGLLDDDAGVATPAPAGERRP